MREDYDNPNQYVTDRDGRETKAGERDRFRRYESVNRFEGGQSGGRMSDASANKAIFVIGVAIVWYALDRYVPLLPGNPRIGALWLAGAAVGLVLLVKRFWTVAVIAVVLYGGYQIYGFATGKETAKVVSIDEANGR